MIMKQYITKHWLKIVLIILSTFFITLFVISRVNGPVNGVKNRFYGNTVASATKITCSIPQFLNAYYSNNMIEQKLSQPETNPLILTFSDFNSDSDLAELSYIDATQTISTVPLLKYVNNDEKLIFLDGTGENYFSVYTIFKKTGVIIYSKSVDLLGTASGSLAMGSCVNSY